MKRLFSLQMLLLMFCYVAAGQSPSVMMDITPTHYSKYNLFMSTVAKPLQPLLQVIKHDLEFTNQFDVTIEHTNAQPAKKDITALAQRGYPLAIFINESSDQSGIEYRVYDTAQVKMIKGAKYKKRGTDLRGWAHNTADALWAIVAGQKGFFSTKIAYAKDIATPHKKKVKHIYVADYDGSNAQALVSLPTVNIAPRWNNDAQSPLLFYSEYTNSNVRLISVSMDKKRKIASNFDGVNMLPAFCPNGKHVAYCASHGQGNCQLYYYDKGFKQLTCNNGNNVSPTFSADGNALYFCSDYQTGKPQLYCYDIKRRTTERLTDGGYCAAPNYCPVQNSLAYSKMVQGTMQLFTYDLVSKKHTQLTFDAGNKEECSWSPCGNFILFCHETNDKSRIAMFDTVTQSYQFITDQKDFCSYPSWSPIYNEFPIVS